MPRIKQSISHTGLQAARYHINNLKEQQRQLEDKLRSIETDEVVAKDILRKVVKDVMREQKEKYGSY